MSSEATTEDRADSLDGVSSLDNHLTTMYLESASSDDEVSDDEVNANIWSEIHSESDDGFQEDHGIVEKVTPTSQDSTTNCIDRYRYFITDEILRAYGSRYE